MSILSNLLDTGAFDADGAELLYTAVESTGRRHGFPPPDGHARWDRTASIECAHQFLIDAGTKGRLVQIAALADDDQSFDRLLRKAVLNYLRTQGRRTVIGKQMRRIRDVLEEDPNFAITGSGLGPLISMSGVSPEEIYDGNEDVLDRAVFKSGPTVPRRWRPDARREGPVANRAEVASLVREILLAAQASVPLGQIARVVARRFNLTDLPATTEIDALDPEAPSMLDEAELSDQARNLLDQLTERERAVLPLLDSSSRAAAQELRLGHSTVAKTQARLRDLLREQVPNDADGSTILRIIKDVLDA